MPATTPASSLRQQRRSWLFDLSLLFLIITICYVLFLGGHAAINPDEGRYASVAREMLETGDFVTPKVNGVIFFDKPILYYWLQAAAMTVFGVNDWALRFFPALLGILGSLFIYTTGRLLYNRRVGILAACALATSVLYYSGAHFANMDLEVAVFISATLFAFLLSTQDHLQRQREKWLYAAYLFAGAAVLTKGLIGIVFPIMIVGLWILLTHQWHLLKRLCILQGLFLFAMVVLPWIVAVQIQNPDFLYTFFYVQHIQRFLGESFNSHQPTLFYIPLLIGGLLPWTPFTIAALQRSIRSVWRNKMLFKNEYFLLIWPLVILIFFSIPTSKLMGYILPVVPPLILLTAVYLDRIFNKPVWLSARKSVLSLMLLGVIVGLGAFILPYTAFYLDKEYPIVLAYSLGIAALIFAGLCGFALSKTVKWIVAILTVVGITLLIGFSAILTQLHLESTKTLIQSIMPLQATDQLVSYHNYFYDLPLYTGRTVTVVAKWDDEMLTKDNWRGLFANAREQRPETRAWLIDEIELWQRWQQPQRIYLLTRDYRYTDILANAPSTPYVLGTYDDTMLLSNQK